MSLDIAHFAFGAAMTTLVVTYLVPTDWYPRTVVVAGGGWAMLPDAHHVSPVFTDQLRRLHYSSPWMDVFWFHRTLDRLDAGNSKVLAAVFLAFFIATTMAAERRDDRTASLVLAASESSIDPGLPEDEA